VSAYQTSVAVVPGGTNEPGGTSEGSTSRSNEPGTPGGIPVGSIDGPPEGSVETLAVGGAPDGLDGGEELAGPEAEGAAVGSPVQAAARTTSAAARIARRIEPA
jgi:hypothetical protein